MEKGSQDKSKRLFRSGILEKFTRVHPAFAISYNLLIISSMLYVNHKYSYTPNLLTAVGIFFAGFVTWTLAEYLLHRFFFHITEKQSAFFAKVAHTVHGIHHDFPNDYHRLFMPPVPATLFITIFFGVFYLLMGTKVFLFLPGFMFGYLCYAFTHFKIHQVKAPKKLKWLWTHHLKHHYQEDDKAYGVSSPFWDIVFRTLPKKSAVKDVEKVNEAKENSAG